MTTRSGRPVRRAVPVLGATLAASVGLAIAGCAAPTTAPRTVTVTANVPAVRALPPEPPAVPAVAAAADLGAPSAQVAAAEERVLELANEARAAAGVPPLERDPKLDAVARGWSAHLAADGLDLAHNPDVVAQLPAGWSAWGENVGWTSDAGADPADVAATTHEQWMASPGHRDNLLDPAFTRVGIGVGVGPGGWYLTQDFVAD